MVGYGHEAINGKELTSAEYSEAGLASGIATRLIIQPLDVLKIRFQLQEEPIRGVTSGKYKGVIQSIRLILKEEGGAALWKGHVPAQGLSAMYGLVQFSSFEWLSSMVANRLPSSSSDFVCGSLAGCIAMTAAMPLDVIRTRLVAQGNQGVVYRGTLHAVTHIWKREGVVGYFRGWVPSLMQIAPFTGLQFAFYNMLIELWSSMVTPNHNTTGVLFAGATAGTVAKTLLYPLDMVRHRLQMNGFERKGFGKASRYHQGMLHAMAAVMKNESVYGYLISLHSLCFTFSKLAFGIATDKFSCVILLLSGLTAVSASIIGLSYADSFASVLLAVVCIGAMQGGGWCPSTRLVGQWYKGASYSTMFSLLGCGTTIAGLYITTLKDVYWRDACVTLGGASLVFCAVSAFILRADGVAPMAVHKPKEGPSPFRQIVSSKVVWGIACGNLLSLQCRTVCETWLPMYLHDNKISTSTYLVVYECAGILATLFSGVVLERLCRVLPLDTARKGLAVFCTISMLISLMLATSFPTHYMVFGALCGGFMNSSVNMWSLISSQAGEAHFAGSCSAFISFVGTFGPIIGGSPLAHLVSLYGYSVFLPFFATEIVLFLCVVALRLPIRMTTKPKDD